ncbi:FAD-dependent oxidoreductase [Brevibacterium casei]|uniref:FAD-dependent oxidoreductase n=1 Tax=Brevibacterium casei TaxID=33889 RepID=UPI0024683CBB|nr:FAD-dependent oxidoreductase [Brevibacterium casei]MDH5149682.1 FAD-dependent oxidoreductase [Brevibacterium casei]
MTARTRTGSGAGTEGRLRPADRHAVRLPAAPGRSRPLRPKSVTVIGGGIAGLNAAAVLAERGVDVVLVESGPRLGGRVSAWPLPGGRTMSRGFHAFFRQYYNLRDLLRRADPDLSRLRPLADYPLTRRGGATDSFAAIPTTPPFNLAGFVLSSPTFPLSGLTEIDTAAAFELIDVDFPDSFARYDGESAAAFLDRLRFPAEARHLALEVFARSFFADPDDFSAGELVAMFHTYFAGSSEGLLFDVPTDDYDTALWAPLGDHLADLGVRIETDRTATALRCGPRRWTVTTDSGEVDSDAVVLAADPAAARRLVATLRADEPAEAEWASRVAATRNAPPFAVLRLWFDGPVDPDRPAFLGTSGFDLLDNVSRLDRFEAGAADWVREHGGSVVELHAYALTGTALQETAVSGAGVSETAVPETAMPQGGASQGAVAPRAVVEKAIADRLLADLHTVWPETSRLTARESQLLIRDDCGLTDPRPWHERPGVETPLTGLVLAGDWVRCDAPVALMERAATTGALAANALLARWRVAGTDLWSPPPRGLLRRGLLGRMRRTTTRG